MKAPIARMRASMDTPIERATLRNTRSAGASPGSMTRGSSSGSRTVGAHPGSTETAMDGVARARIGRLVEDLCGRSRLDDGSGRARLREEEGAVLGDPRRLLHVVGHDDDRDVLSQLRDRLLDVAG